MFHDTSPAKSWHQSWPHEGRFCALRNSGQGALEEPSSTGGRYQGTLWLVISCRRKKQTHFGQLCSTTLARSEVQQQSSWRLSENWRCHYDKHWKAKVWLWILFIQVTPYIQHVLAALTLSQPVPLGIHFTCFQCYLVLWQEVGPCLLFEFVWFTNVNELGDTIFSSGLGKAGDKLCKSGVS